MFHRIVMALLLVGNLLEAQPIQFYTFQDALRQSKLTNKDVVLVIAQSQCRHCHNQINGMINDPQLSKLLQRYFIVSLWVADRNGGYPQGVPFEGITPATYIFRQGQLLYGPFSGEIPPQEFYTFLYQFI